jgi:hypothetical protein
VVYIPRGASFTDKVAVKPANASGARFSKSNDTTTDGASTDSSATAPEILPGKRPRKASHRTREDAPTYSAPPTPPQAPAYPQPYPNHWGWPSPAMWSAPPWAVPPYGYHQAPMPPAETQRPHQRTAPFPEHPQPQSSLAMPTGYPQWSAPVQPIQPPPPPQGLSTHQPYAQPADSGAAHPAAY